MRGAIVIIAVFAIFGIIYAIFQFALEPWAKKELEKNEKLDEETRKRILGRESIIVILLIIVFAMVLGSCDK